MMKVSKLLKIGTLALLAASLCFVSCKKEDDDDENEMLSGSNNNYSINYSNSSSSVSRGYKTTTFKHLGSLCQMTMNKDNKNSGAMGYIWDLESNSNRAAKDPRRFFIVGFNYDGSVVKPYVSLYKNVTDIQLNNFGATASHEKESGSTATSTGATEKEYIALGSTSFTPTIDTSTGDFVVTINVYEGTFDSDGKWKDTDTSYKAGDYDGTYHVDIYNGKYEKDQLPLTAAASCKIEKEDVGYVTIANNVATVTSNGTRQKNGAVYANVYAGKTLKGSWKYADTYSADEVVEE